MNVSPRILLTVALATAAQLAACVPSSANMSKALYAARYKCPAEQLEAETQQGFTVVTVRGCGYEQLYTCGTNCTSEGDRSLLAADAKPTVQ